MTRLREAHAGDAEFVAGLAPRFAEHGAADGHDPQTVIEGTIRVLTAALRAPKDGDVFLIAEDERGERTGFAYVVTAEDFFTGEAYAHVSEIAVARSGAGVGAELMDAAERWARERGYRMISLNVVEENVPGQRFYERRGYALGHRHYVKRL
ncbi:MAG TPA: GNAT family N-acetyltransferase [Candidatus Elarobacter sp.]|nr:GNAT family N-acetyltransferase [Candidatus Elarobacter sp.]